MTTPDRQLGAELTRIDRGTSDAILAEVRRALRRRGVWPVGPPRPGRRHSRDTMLVTGRRSVIRIRNPQRHAWLLEHRPTLRRRRNRHAGGLRRALTRLWPRITRRAAATAAA